MTKIKLLLKKQVFITILTTKKKVNFEVNNIFSDYFYSCCQDTHA